MGDSDSTLSLIRLNHKRAEQIDLDDNRVLPNWREELENKKRGWDGGFVETTRPSFDSFYLSKKYKSG